MFPCDYIKEQYKFGYSCYTYFKDGYRKYGPAVPHSLIYKKLKPFRIGIERTFGLVKENRYSMEISNFYKGIDNVTINTIEHDIVLTQDITFDYIKPVNLAQCLILIIEQALLKNPTLNQVLVKCFQHEKTRLSFKTL